MSFEEALQWRTQTLLSRVQEARVSVAHEGLYGENNEGLLIETLRELLPAEWEIGGGEVVDVDGKRSPQCDVIIYNRNALPPAYVGPTGRVAVMAHAVGAVVEVKSLLNSGPAMKELCEQASALAAFISEARRTGKARIDAEAARQAANDDVSAVLRSICDAAGPGIWGFAYGSEVQLGTLKTHVPLTEGLPQVFVLDVPQAAEDIKHQLEQLGPKPTKPQILEFADRLRRPNGYSFEVHGYNDGTADQATLQVDESAHGANGLRVFIKEISDIVRRRSALGHLWSPRAAEIIYSAYNPWENTYA